MRSVPIADYPLVTGSKAGRWTMDLIAKGRLTPSKIITHRMPSTGAWCNMVRESRGGGQWERREQEGGSDSGLAVLAVHLRLFVTDEAT